MTGTPVKNPAIKPAIKNGKKSRAERGFTTSAGVTARAAAKPPTDPSRKKNPGQEVAGQEAEQESPSRIFIRLFDSQTSLYEYYSRKNGLQGKALAILLWIYYSPRGITQKTIAKRTLSTKQVVNATIKTWREKGYIADLADTADGGPPPDRIFSRPDRRQKKIALTTAGRIFAAGILDPLRQAEDRAMASLTPVEQNQLVALYAAYSQAFTAILTALPASARSSQAEGEPIEAETPIETETTALTTVFPSKQNGQDQKKSFGKRNSQEGERIHD